MSRKRVIWSEGLFLRPQHFQQLERSLEGCVDARVAGTLAPGWGFSALQLDEELLKRGRIAVRAARGVMPDGTPFAVSQDHAAPLALEIGSDVRNTRVHLALPLARAGMAEFAVDSSPETALVRFVGQDERVDDNVLGLGESAEMKLGAINLRLMLEDEPRAGFCSLSVARVKERAATGQVVLDPDWIPPALDTNAFARLHDVVVEARNLVRHRADALAGRLGASSKQGMGEIGELLMLQVANRFDAWLTHLEMREHLHPEMLYSALVQAAGEFATFSDQRKRRARPQAPYRHDDLQATFAPLILDIRDLLAEVINPGAVPIPLQDRGAGLYTGLVGDPELLRSAQFVLAVNAEGPAETVRQSMPHQMKIGTTDRIRDLVRLNLPGIPVEALPTAPPRMPYYAGYTYFQLHRSGDMWKQLDANRVLALHVAGDFPGLKLELWALKP